MSQNSIFLAIFPPQGEEVHIKWEGHKTLEDAKEELSKIRDMMIKQDKIPMDCCVYEAENPPFGLASYKLDDVDFNFYREKTEDEKARSMESFNKAMSLVKKEAEKESLGNA